MKAAGNAQQASIVAVLGSSGSGKTTTMQDGFKRPRAVRTFAWSPKEYADHYAELYPSSVTVRTAGEFLAVAKAAGRGSFHVVFVPSLERSRDEAQFDSCCRTALAFGNLTFLVDELHTVTRASGGQEAWRKLVMMGRSKGIKIIAGSQRPASVDKDFLGNCSIVRTGRLAYPEDAKAVAKAINVKPEQVMALTGFSWLARDMLTGKNLSG